jgi:hypothetical protein
MVRRVVYFAAAVGLIVAEISLAGARQARASECEYRNDGKIICMGGAVEKTAKRSRRVASVDPNGNTIIIGGRPAGCPHKYCGCGLARYLGLDDKRLWRAWSWAQLFPRSSASAGKAVVWRSHVALIVEMRGPREALLRDYNSGGGLSRLHVRSIAGAVIVDPSTRASMK